MTTTRTPAANRFRPIDPQPDGAPPMPNQTDKTLVQIRTELLTTFSATDWESYNHLVSWLRDTDWPALGSFAPGVYRRGAAERQDASVIARWCLCGILNRRSLDDSTYRYDSSSR